jgi:hypothetical protein
MPLDESVELLSGGIMVWRHICNNVLDKGRVLLTAVWQERHCANCHTHTYCTRNRQYRVSTVLALGFSNHLA